MKKLFCILISALMLFSVLPLGAVSFAEKAEPSVNEAAAAAPSSSDPTSPVKAGYGTIDFDFDEVDPAADYGFTFLDADGDGRTWHSVSSLSGYYSSHSGEWAMYSESYDTDFGPISPDNWMITPAIEFSAQPDLYFWIKSHNVRYPNDYVYLYYSLDDGLTWTEIGCYNDYEEWTRINVDIRECMDETAKFAFRHCDCEDEWGIYIDDIEFRDARLSTVVSSIFLDGFSEPGWGASTADVPAVREGSPYSANVWWEQNATGSLWEPASGYFDKDGIGYRLAGTVTLNTGYEFGSCPEVYLNSTDDYWMGVTVSGSTLSFHSEEFSLSAMFDTSDIYAFYNRYDSEGYHSGWYRASSDWSTGAYDDTEANISARTIYESNSLDIIAAAAYSNDFIYYCDANNNLHSVKVSGGEHTLIGHIEDDYVDSLSFDQKTGYLYCLFHDYDGARFGSVFPEDATTGGYGYLTGLANPNERHLIVSADNGAIYCVDTSTGVIYKVNTDYYSCTVYGKIDADYKLSNVFYNNITHQLYAVTSYGSDYNALLYVFDLNTKETTLCCEMDVGGRKFMTAAAPSRGETALHYVDIRLENGIVPVVGELKEHHLNPVAESGCRCSVIGDPYFTDPSWKNVNTFSGESEFQGEFLEGQTYYLDFYLQADPGCYFADDCVFMINHSEAFVSSETSSFLCDNATFHFKSIEMPAAAQSDLISTVNVDGFYPPLIGATVASCTDFSIPEWQQFASCYSIDYALVVDETIGDTVSGDDVFIEGHVYRYYINLTAADGCYFSQDVVGYLSNSSTYVDSEESFLYNEKQFMLRSTAITALTPIHVVFVDDFTIPIMIGDNAEDCLNISSYDSRFEIYHSTWIDADTHEYFTGDFEEGEYYYCGCAMIAADGYCFAPDCIFYINNTDTFVDHSWVERDLRTAQVFTVNLEPIDDSKLIHSIDLIEFTYPIVGETAEGYLSTISAPLSEHYHVVRIEGGELSVGLMGNDDVFEAGHEYYLAVYVVADDGYYIADDCTFWLEGTNAYVDPEGSYKASPNSAWVGIGPCPAKQLITELEIYADIAPVAGENASDHLSYYVDGNADCFYTCWVDFYDHGDVLNFDGAFVEGNDYYRHFVISADDGYIFADDLAITVQGVPAGYEVMTVGMAIKVDSVAYTSLSAIDTINLVNVVLPEPGQTVAEYKAQLGVPNGADYTIAFIGIMHSGDIGYLSDDYVFVEGENYAVYAYFNPVNGRMFTGSDQLNFLVNGQSYLVQNGSLIESDRTTAMCYTKELVCVDADHIIYNINVKGFLPPMIGHTVDEFFSGCYIADSEHYFIGAISASDVTDPEDPQYLPFGYAYEAGFEYEYAFTLQPDEGYYFSPDCEFWFDWDGTYVNYTRSDASDPEAAYLCTIPLSALTPITFVNLDGFTIPPMIGESAADCLGISIFYSDGDCEIIDETWIDTDYDNFTGIFTAYDEYQCAVTLLVDDGFCFDPDCTVLINGSKYYLDNVYVSASCYVMYVYTVFLEAADDSHFIHEIDLSGLVWPVVGDPVIDFMTCLEPESGAPYTIASRTAGESGGAPFDGSETFDEGNYILVVTVQADPGWYIADDCVFRVDGSTLIVDPEGSYVVSANYARIKVGPLEAKAAITAVDFTGVAAPQAGQTFGDYCAAIAVPNSADYAIYRIICADSYDGSTLTNTSTFTAGHSYIFQIYVTPADDDHLFTVSASATINGGTELVSMFSVDSGRYLATVTTVPILCEAPAGLLGDVDLNGSVTSVDAVLVMRYILGYMQLSGQQLINADYDGNGNIDALDALQIMRKAMHLI